MASLHHVGAGSGIPSEWELCFPEDFPGVLIEGAESFIGGSANKEEPSGGDNRSSVVFCSGGWDPSLGEFGILAEDYLPLDFPRIEIDRVKGAPGGLDSGVAFRVQIPSESTKSV